MLKVLNGTWDMGHGTFCASLSFLPVKIIYGTFQCKLWHFLAKTMAVCVFCQKNVDYSENN